MINYPSLGDLMEKATTQEACLAEEYMLIKRVRQVSLLWAIRPYCEELSDQVNGCA
ncbi:hypothetical protein F2Q70_00015228 [Brassica cretica]|uniref:Uncharacterized protein n=1 Tax=Brassica cretica TaxID=69181 RepID=A0A8S9I0L1_BRACR|nr:hypothetical protein F2Q70_00015228 [Brassica cretica]